jgi:hypothetical protein
MSGMLQYRAAGVAPCGRLVTGWGGGGRGGGDWRAGSGVSGTGALALAPAAGGQGVSTCVVHTSKAVPLPLYGH